MDENLRSAQANNGVSDFGDARISYRQLDNDQILYVDELSVHLLCSLS